jgi:hypothetical protein
MRAAKWALGWMVMIGVGCGAGTRSQSVDGGQTGSGAGGEIFIAEPGDFEPFRAWFSVALGNDPNSADPPGSRIGFLSQHAPAGAHEYAVGTLIVKAIENTPTPDGWDLFAMAKRGGNFDYSGARGWEFFILQLAADGSVKIDSRGSTLDPTDMGNAYGGPGVILCSGCHGAQGTEATDHVLSPELAPGK